VAVDLHQHFFKIGFTLDPAEGAVGQAWRFVEIVIPGKVEQRSVARVGRAGV
jgi:hypothetical protein